MSIGLQGRAGRQLGDDLLGHIFKLLNARDLAASELVCCHWQNVIFRSAVWRHHAEVAWDGQAPLKDDIEDRQSKCVEKTGNGVDCTPGPQPCDYMSTEWLELPWRDRFLRAACWRRMCGSPLPPLSGGSGNCSSEVRRQQSAAEELTASVQQHHAGSRMSSHDQNEEGNSWMTLSAIRMPGSMEQATVLVAHDSVIAGSMINAPQTVCLWDAVSHKPVRTLKLPSALEAATFAGSTTLLVTACAGGRAMLWKQGSLIC